MIQHAGIADRHRIPDNLDRVSKAIFNRLIADLENISYIYIYHI